MNTQKENSRKLKVNLLRLLMNKEITLELFHVLVSGCFSVKFIDGNIVMNNNRQLTYEEVEVLEQAYEAARQSTSFVLDYKRHNGNLISKTFVL